MFTIKVEYLFIVAVVIYAYLSYKYNKDEEEFND
jgi:hypothetical protein